MLTRLRARLELGGLRLRIGAIVFIHALLAYATLALFTSSGPVPTDRVYMLPQPDRVEAIVLAFERAPPDTYPDLIRAMDDDRQEVRILSAPRRPAASAAETGATADQASDRYRAALAGRSFWIDAKGHDVLGALDRQQTYSPIPYRVVVGLSGGSAVEIVRYTTSPVARFINRRQWLNVAIVGIDLIVIFWLASQSTRPVERLLRAVRSDNLREVGRDGAREFRELGIAFRELRERLQDVLEERSRIIAAIAHDFRTYLTRLELRTDFIDNPDQRERAMRDLHEMRQLMDDVFTFARPDADAGDSIRSVDIVGTLRQIIEHRGESAETILFDAPDTKLMVQATPLAFERMVGNLLDNALRYGGGPIQLTAAAHNQNVLICVEDNGPGVPDDRLRDLTKPFVRLETSRGRETGGVGLGLSIVEALAHRFGGALQLENRSEGGLRARLLLCRAISPSADTMR